MRAMKLDELVATDIHTTEVRPSIMKGNAVKVLKLQ